MKTTKGLDSLQELKDRLIAEEEREREEKRKQAIKEHKKRHIFSTFEEALDWLVANPDRGIDWYGDSLYWDEKKQMIELYGQRSDYDGINFWNVHYYITRDELLRERAEHKEWFENEYPEKRGQKWWLDEWGKLEHVYTYRSAEEALEW